MALCDAVEDVLPLGNDECSIAVERYNEDSKDRGRQQRELESLKKKFDKIVAVKKPTGNPSCPEEVRRGKK